MTAYRTTKILSVLLVVSALIGCSRTPQSLEAQHMKRAKDFLAKKDYKSAVLEFKIASQNMPKDAEPLYQLAMTYLRTGVAPLAYEGFRKAAEVNPGHEGSRYELALFRVGSDKPDMVEDAKRVLVEYVAAHPGDPESMGALALADAKTGDDEEALKLLRASLEKAPSNTRAALAVLGYYGTHNDVPRSVAISRHLTDHIPQSPEVAVMRAEVSLASGDMKDVDAQTDRALSLRKGYVPALALRLRRELLRGEINDAEKTTQEVAEGTALETASAYARLLFSEKKVTEGIAEFERVLKQRGNNLRLLNEYAALLIGSGHSKEARAVIDRTLKINPKERSALLQRISLEITDGKLDAAAADVKTLQGMKAFSSELSFEESRIFEARGDTVRQGDLLAEALQQNPRLVVARLTLARLLVAAGQAGRALYFLDQASSAEQLSPQWLFARNLALIMASRWDEARKGVDRGVTYFRTSPFLYQSAFLWFRVHDIYHARVAIDEAYKLAPDNPGVIALMGAIMKQQGATAQYLKTLTDAAARKPDSAPLQSTVAQMMAASGDTKAARAGFARAEQAGDIVKAECGLAELDIQAGALGAAEQRLNELIKTHDDERARMLLAHIATVNGAQPEVAVRHYLRAIQLQPTNAVAMNNLAEILASRESKLDDAKFWSEKAQAHDPNDPRMDDTLGWIIYRQGKYAQALPYLEKSLRELDRPVAHYHLAAVLAKTGDMQRGRSEYEVGVKQDPQSSARNDASPFFDHARSN